VEKIREVANAKGATVAQIAIAWVLARWEGIVPLVGPRKRERLSESLGALNVKLTPDDLSEIAKAGPKNAAAGSRYAEFLMRELDSERKAS
jgi:pyridoxine 4-dehydrogenase